MSHKNTTDVFRAEESPCCFYRVRVTIGKNKLCLSWRQAKNAGRALKQLGSQAQETEAIAQSRNRQDAIRFGK